MSLHHKNIKTEHSFAMIGLSVVAIFMVYIYTSGGAGSPYNKEVFNFYISFISFYILLVVCYLILYFVYGGLKIFIHYLRTNELEEECNAAVNSKKTVNIFDRIKLLIDLIVSKKLENNCHDGMDDHHAGISSDVYYIL